LDAFGEVMLIKVPMLLGPLGACGFQILVFAIFANASEITILQPGGNAYVIMIISKVLMLLFARSFTDNAVGSSTFRCSSALIDPTPLLISLSLV